MMRAVHTEVIYTRTDSHPARPPAPNRPAGVMLAPTPPTARAAQALVV